MHPPRGARALTPLLLTTALAGLAGSGLPAGPPAAPGVPAVERDVPVRMRDGVVLAADVWRPAGEGRFPVIVYRTPYGRSEAATRDGIPERAVARGYAVVLQDVRGRHGSGGRFDPYRHEGRDGYDTIEWAARQPWSNGAVGTYGLSYPGAVQWLAALESPPHLRAMAPAMTFSSPRHFFYFGGIFDRSWVPWIYLNIAPDLRRRGGLPGPRTVAEAAREWERIGGDLQARLPLSRLPELRDVAPFYFEWLDHPPTDPWWDWGEIRGRYDRVEAAVLNLSGWHDEAYGPEGATTNFNGLRAARAGEADARTRLVLGPWTHGVGALGERRIGELDFGPEAPLDYADLVLDWMDRWLRGAASAAPVGAGEAEAGEAPVRFFVMGANRWREASAWPPPGAAPRILHLAPPEAGSRAGRLERAPPAAGAAASLLPSDPARPVVAPAAAFGPHDHRRLAGRPDVLVFDPPPLEADLEVTGPLEAVVFLSCDCPDTDLWVRVLDVHPDGSAYNLMSPGADALRASYREPGRGRQLLAPGAVVRLRLPHLMTSHFFRRHHRIRVQLSTSFAPFLSHNLHTGELETTSREMRPARVKIHHDRGHPSRVVLPTFRVDGRSRLD